MNGTEKPILLITELTDLYVPNVTVDGKKVLCNFFKPAMLTNEA